MRRARLRTVDSSSCPSVGLPDEILDGEAVYAHDGGLPGKYCVARTNAWNSDPVPLTTPQSLNETLRRRVSLYLTLFRFFWAAGSEKRDLHGFRPYRIISIIMWSDRARVRYSSASWLERYLVAVLSLTVTLLVRAALGPLLPERSPYMLFNLAVMVSAWYGGFGPGLMTSLLSAFLAHHFFVRPNYWFSLAQRQDGLAIALFLIVTVSISWLAQLLRSATLRAEEGEKRIGEILESIGDNFIALDRNWCVAYQNLDRKSVV